MAIDIAKGIATQVVNNQLRKVAGNLPGLLGINKGKIGINSSDTAPLNQKSQNSPNLFQFPLDVAGDVGVGNHGHYIIFFINEQENSQLSFAGKAKDGKDTIVKEKSRRAIPNFIRKNFGGRLGYQSAKNTDGEDTISSSGSNVLKPDVDSGINPYQSQANIRKQMNVVEGGQVVRLRRPPTRRLDTAIAMYMPSSVQATYKSKYNDQQIGGLATAAAGLYRGVKAGESFGESLIRQLPLIAEDLKNKGIKIASTLLDGTGLAAGAKEAIEISTGVVIADRMELAFENVERRSFSYDFKMIPKNAREADEIRKIVFAFKANMLPEMVGGRNRETMTVPNTFNIQYMYRGKENDYIHRVSECFLTSADVTYGGDRYKTFDPHNNEGAPPQQVNLKLEFSEIEIITRERIFEGY